MAQLTEKVHLLTCDVPHIALPLFLHVFLQSDVDMAWIAIIAAMNLQTSFLTPPFGWALFLLKGVAPPEARTSDMYKGVLPFIGIQLFGLSLVYFLPRVSDGAAPSNRMVSHATCSFGI